MRRLQKGRRWNQKDKLHLKRNWGKKTPQTLARELKRTPGTIKTMAWKMGLNKVEPAEPKEPAIKGPDVYQIIVQRQKEAGFMESEKI